VAFYFLPPTPHPPPAMEGPTPGIAQIVGFTGLAIAILRAMRLPKPLTPFRKPPVTAAHFNTAACRVSRSSAVLSSTASQEAGPIRISHVNQCQHPMRWATRLTGQVGAVGENLLSP
jgi:hypothetical protein